MNKLNIEISKFSIIGAANFVLTFIIFTSMLKGFKINYAISLVVASVIGVVFTYVLNYQYVFKPEKKIQFKSYFIKYVSASGLSIVLNLMILSYIVGHTPFDPYYIQIALIPFIVVFNFSTAKFWSFK